MLAVVLLYFSFRGVNWHDFLEALGSCRWEWILAAMICGVISFWLRALRWRELLLPLDSSTTVKTAFNAINIGLVMNLVLPRVGELIRCGFITRHSAAALSGSMHRQQRMASYDKVLGTVVMERSWDVVTLLLLVSIVFVSMWGRFGNFLMDKIVRPFAGNIDLGIWWIPAILVCAGVLCIWLLCRFHAKSRITETIYRFMTGILQGIASCLKMKRWWMFLIYTALIWIMYWLMSQTILLAVQGMDTSALPPGLSEAVERLSGLGALDALFLMLAGSLSSLVPVPGGFGAFHYIVATALSTVYGVPFGLGIVFATLSHESQTITQILCGGVSYVSESRQFMRENENGKDE